MAFVLPIALVIVSGIGSLLAVWPVVRHRTTEGVALESTLSCMLGTATWVVYGLMRDNDAQVVANAVATIGALLIIGVGLRTGRLRTKRSLTLTVFFASTVAAAALVGGTLAVGLLVSGLSILNKIPQAVETWRRPGGRGLSVPANVWAAIVAAGWGLYGLAQLDIWLSVSSFWSAGQAVFVAVRTASARRNTLVSSSVEQLQPVAA